MYFHSWFSRESCDEQEIDDVVVREWWKRCGQDISARIVEWQSLVIEEGLAGAARFSHVKG